VLTFCYKKILSKDKLNIIDCEGFFIKYTELPHNKQQQKNRPIKFLSCYIYGLMQVKIAILSNKRQSGNLFNKSSNPYSFSKIESV
jgi:hypothetical protein